MSENLNEDLQKFEEIQAMLDGEEKGMHDDEKGAHEDEKGAPSVFMTDIRFKEMQDAGELISEEAFAELSEDDQLLMEKVLVMDEKVMDEKGETPMGWMFRFKSEDDEEETDADEEEDAEEEAAEEEADEDETDEADDEAEEADEEEADEEEADEDDEDDDDVSEKAAVIMSMMRKPKNDKPSIFLTDSRFKEMMEDGELVSDEDYDGLDEDAKGAFEAVDVYEEGTGKGYGRRYRRRSPLELNAMRKAEDENAVEDVFETAEEAMERAEALGCEGMHRAGKMFMPCASHDEWMELSKKEMAAKKEREATQAEAARAARQAQAAQAAQQQAQGAAPAGMPAEGMKSDDFLCGFSRKSVNQPCEFCQGGCMPTEDLPGLGDIESQVKSLHEGSEVVGSGYSTADDIFVVDVKRADGSCIQVFLSGEGEEMGWLRIDEDELDAKSGELQDIVSQADAEDAAVKALEDLDIKGDVMGVLVDVFANQDVYVVEVDTDEKSYDVFVSPEGKVLGFDEYEVENPFDYDMDEEDELKALEAELEIKRMYSREQREAMAESGDALPDGSFPIADAADLDNAIQAYGRAKDKAAAKEHIMKRAKELGKEDMIPADWNEEEPEAPEAEADAPAEKEEDVELINALAEFQNMLDGEDLA